MCNDFKFFNVIPRAHQGTDINTATSTGTSMGTSTTISTSTARIRAAAVVGTEATAAAAVAAGMDRNWRQYCGHTDVLGIYHQWIVDYHTIITIVLFPLTYSQQQEEEELRVEYPVWWTSIAADFNSSDRTVAVSSYTIMTVSSPHLTFSHSADGSITIVPEEEMAGQTGLVQSKAITCCDLLFVRTSIVPCFYF